jgi:hypothetical protein
MPPAVAPVVCTLRREVGLPWNSSSKRYIIGPTGSLKIFLNTFYIIIYSSSVKKSLILTALVLKSFKWYPDTVPIRGRVTVWVSWAWAWAVMRVMRGRGDEDSGPSRHCSQPYRTPAYRIPRKLFTATFNTILWVPRLPRAPFFSLT